MQLTDISIWPAQERSAYAAGWNDRQAEVARLAAAINKFLDGRMAAFCDSRAVDDDLVELAAALSSSASKTEKP